MLYHNWQLKSKQFATKKNLLSLLANNRNLKTKKEIAEFLNPTLSLFFDLKLSGITKAINRIEKAIQTGEKIIVYSDYDADGICGTAILWETLNYFGANVLPYVPDRVSEGYGLNSEAIRILAKDDVTLIITVDHGVNAKKQIEQAADLGIEVIVTDHHSLPQNLPVPFALVHTTDLAGCGVAFKLAHEFAKTKGGQDYVAEKIDLVALATIADLVPLTGFNRALVKFGLQQINKTARSGLKVLIENSSLNYGEIDAWHLGFVIAPKINASGRLDNAIQALRLLCTKNYQHARVIAAKLLQTNNRRQELTSRTIEQARGLVVDDQLIGVVANSEWHEGVIGLVAARLVEEFYRPMIVISQAGEISKGSARSVAGFNIIEAIRQCSDLLIDAGGHPMAAGFTIKTSQIEAFSQKITTIAAKKLDETLLTKSLEIDAQIELSEIDWDFYNLVERFKPFGIGNPEPVFLVKKAQIHDAYAVGVKNQHLKLILSDFEAIGFGQGKRRVELRPGDFVGLAFSLSKNSWNGGAKIELRLRDISVS